VLRELPPITRSSMACHAFAAFGSVKSNSTLGMPAIVVGPICGYASLSAGCRGLDASTRLLSGG
jgi:hypothetical protein